MRKIGKLKGKIKGVRHLFFGLYLFFVLFRSISCKNRPFESFVLHVLAHFGRLRIAGIMPAAGIVININLQSAG